MLNAYCIQSQAHFVYVQLWSLFCEKLFSIFPLKATCMHTQTQKKIIKMWREKIWKWQKWNDDAKADCNEKEIDSVCRFCLSSSSFAIEITSFAFQSCVQLFSENIPFTLYPNAKLYGAI